LWAGPRRRGEVIEKYISSSGERASGGGGEKIFTNRRRKPASITLSERKGEMQKGKKLLAGQGAACRKPFQSIGGGRWKKERRPSLISFRIGKSAKKREKKGRHPFQGDRVCRQRVYHFSVKDGEKL